jgi:hypothetical protein
MSIRVEGVAKKVQFPLLPLARTQILSDIYKFLLTADNTLDADGKPRII